MKSLIEWTENSRSVVHGCAPVDPLCLNCYAARMQGTRHRRLPVLGGSMCRGELVTCKSAGKAGGRRYIFNGEGGLDRKAIADSLKRSALPAGVCFWNHTSDTFWERLTDEEIAAQFAVMSDRLDVKFLVLTKRAQRMRAWFAKIAALGPAALAAEMQSRIDCGSVAARQAAGMSEPRPPTPEVRALLDLGAPIINAELAPRGHRRLRLQKLSERHWRPWPLDNIALGVSVGTRNGLHRVDDLRATPAAMRFLSIEPLLEDLGALNLDGIAWVIVGCESGPGARPTPLYAIRSIRDQCAAAGVAFFLKQADICPACDGSGIARDLDREQIEVPTTEYHWGKQHIVTPRVVDHVFGDGRATIWVAPLNTRPNYYVVRVDSARAEDMDSDGFRDMIDEVVDEVEDQFGAHEDHDGDCTDECQFPRLHYGAGVAWGRYSLVCASCKGTGQTGKVRKHNPALDGMIHDARPPWLTGGAQ